MDSSRVGRLNSILMRTGQLGLQNSTTSLRQRDMVAGQGVQKTTGWTEDGSPRPVDFSLMSPLGSVHVG